jgi:hypothetical protein
VGVVALFLGGGGAFLVGRGGIRCGNAEVACEY